MKLAIFAIAVLLTACAETAPVELTSRTEVALSPAGVPAPSEIRGSWHAYGQLDGDQLRDWSAPRPLLTVGTASITFEGKTQPITAYSLEPSRGGDISDVLLTDTLTIAFTRIPAAGGCHLIQIARGDDAVIVGNYLAKR